MGKNPEQLEGYAYDTAKVYASVLDKFHRWAWEHRGEYSLDLDHQDTDTYIRNMIMADNEYSSSYLNNIKLALKAYFEDSRRSIHGTFHPEYTARITKTEMSIGPFCLPTYRRSGTAPILFHPTETAVDLKTPLPSTEHSCIPRSVITGQKLETRLQGNIWL